jgi:hypothetical protein
MNRNKQTVNLAAGLRACRDSSSWHFQPRRLAAFQVERKTMSETKYTPGPWTVSAANKFEIIGPAASQIAECFTPFTKPRAVGTYEIVNANTLLISASPELAEALEECGRVIEGLMDWLDEGDALPDSGSLMPGSDDETFAQAIRVAAHKMRAALRKAGVL